MDQSLTQQFALLEKRIDNSLKYLDELSTQKKKPKFKFNNALDDLYDSSYIKIHSNTKSGEKFKEALWVKDYLIDNEWIYTKDILRLMKLEIVVKSPRRKASGFYRWSWPHGYIVIKNGMSKWWTESVIDHEVGHGVHHLLTELGNKKELQVTKIFYNMLLKNYGEKINPKSQEASIKYYAKKYVSRYAGTNKYEAFAELYAKCLEEVKKETTNVWTRTYDEFLTWAMAQIWNNVKKTKG